MSLCSLCEAALDHCHGTLIVHTDLAVECTEPECDSLDQVRHPRLADCADVIGGCACDPRGIELVIEVVEIREEGHRSLTG
ncbi:hypothetical protein JK358_03825 [Nocardia sp. 2]|uniref:Uncharacterized protein n=1 Tax=Nocardia acididurans TaxID=2802282 RepID=A0ABS1LZ31_9NOCA|nr:hypothetical protein [Nocardia acididurans]MBL1073514.1 hypothetical protein [Nocardia acididurans]